MVMSLDIFAIFDAILSGDSLTISFELTWVRMLFALLPKYRAYSDSCMLPGSWEIQQIIAVWDLPHKDFCKMRVSLLSRKFM